MHAVVVNGMHRDLVGVVVVGVGRRLVVGRLFPYTTLFRSVDVKQVVVAAGRQRIGDRVVGRGAVGVAGIGVVQDRKSGGDGGLAAGGAGREDRRVVVDVADRDGDVLGGVMHAVVVNGMHRDLVGVVVVGVGRRLVVGRHLERHLAGRGVDVKQVVVAAGRQRIGDRVVGRGAVGVAGIGVV